MTAPRVLLPLIAILALASCKVSVNSGDPNPLPPVTAGTSQQREEAIAAAKSIIKTIDRGDYSKVWADSSDLLKDSAGEFVFVNLLKATRGNLGKPKPRNRVRVGFTSRVDPQAPIGEYCVLEVDTDFDGSLVTEKIVMLRSAGTWKLAGYFMSGKKTFSM